MNRINQSGFVRITKITKRSPLKPYFCRKRNAMTYKFEYAKAIEKCGMLSSFEGRELVGDGGESLYLRVRITEQDKPLIREYMERAARSLEDGMSRIITSSEYSEEGFVWEVRTEETRWNVNRKLDENLTDALVGYAMAGWLSDRKPDRIGVYKSLWEDMSVMCVRNMYRKNPPLLK